VDAIDRTDIDASGILGPNARFTDDIRHETPEEALNDTGVGSLLHACARIVAAAQEARPVCDPVPPRLFPPRIRESARARPARVSAAYSSVATWRAAIRAQNATLRLTRAVRGSIG
jgi:hypothetical protein